MLLKDFEQPAAKAFWGGVLKGMAAPVLLFHHEALPEIETPVQVVVVPEATGSAFLNALGKIQGDFVAVMNRHVETR